MASTPLGDLVIEMAKDDGINVQIKVHPAQSSTIINLFRPASEGSNFMKDFSIIDAVQGDDTARVNGTLCRLLETPYTVIMMAPARELPDGRLSVRDKEFHIIKTINRRIHKQSRDYLKQECITLQNNVSLGKKKK
jgi:hypothetical protein